MASTYPPLDSSHPRPPWPWSGVVVAVLAGGVGLLGEPAIMGVPGRLLGGAEGGADLRPGSAHPASRPHVELASVPRLAGDDLAEREPLQRLLLGEDLVVVEPPELVEA